MPLTPCSAPTLNANATRLHLPAVGGGVLFAAIYDGHSGAGCAALRAYCACGAASEDGGRSRSDGAAPAAEIERDVDEREAQARAEWDAMPQDEQLQTLLA